jgi:hypothetical protein
MQLLPDLSEPTAEEIELPADATPLDFLCAVYTNAGQPMPRRMKAAEAALPYVHPKLAVIANVHGFADQMEALARRAGRSNVIDAPKSLPQPADSRMTNPERSGDVG